MIQHLLLGIVSLLSLALPLSAQIQSEQDSLDQAFLKISLPEPATQLLVDEEGNLLVLSPESAQLYKYFFSTQFDSSIVIGGQSNRQDGFLHPTQIAQRNRLNLYLLDDVQRRIVLLTINFKVVQEVDFRTLATRLETLGEESEIFPQSFDINPAGEIFLLNQFNNKIIKVNNFGEIETIFGGLDYGEGSLYDPVELAINKQNFLFVSDTIEQQLKVFDAYGVYRYSIKPEVPFRWKHMFLYESSLICFNDKQIYLEHLLSGKKKNWVLPSAYRIQDVALSSSFFYVLLENEVSLQEHSVHIFQLTP